MIRSARREMTANSCREKYFGVKAPAAAALDASLTWAAWSGKRTARKMPRASPALAVALPITITFNTSLLFTGPPFGLINPYWPDEKRSRLSSCFQIRFVTRERATLPLISFLFLLDRECTQKLAWKGRGSSRSGSSQDCWRRLLHPRQIGSSHHELGCTHSRPRSEDPIPFEQYLVHAGSLRPQKSLFDY